MAEGSPVDLVLSAGPSRVTVPDVRDLPEADAVGALEDAGLVVADTQTRANDDIAAGNALRTDPEAGSEVDPGSEVTLFLSSGPSPWPCPRSWVSGVGCPRRPRRRGLVAGERTEATDESVDAGTIVSQDPAPDSEVAEGTAVDYVVSTGAPIPSIGEGGSLDDAAVAGQLDAVAATTPATRELSLDGTPYDAASNGEQRDLLTGPCGARPR